MKHKDKETQQRRETKQETKKQTFCCSCRFGLLASLWAKSCQGQRAKKHYETRVFVVFSFLFVGVLLGKLTKRTITRTKLRRQDNKTTRQQKTIQEQKQNNNNNNKTTTIINKQQQNNNKTTTTNNNQQQPTTTTT